MVLIIRYFLLFCAIIYFNEAKKEFSPPEIVCMDNLKIDKNYIEAIIEDNSTEFLPENDEVFNKFLHCFFVARNLQDENGELKYENIINHVKQLPRKYFGGEKNDEAPVGLPIATEATLSCKNLPRRDTYGKTAVQAQNCIDRKMTELIQEGQ